MSLFIAKRSLNDFFRYPEKLSFAPPLSFILRDFKYLTKSYLDSRMHEETSNDYYLTLITIMTLCNNQWMELKNNQHILILLIWFNIFQKFFIIPMKHTSNMIVCIISDIYHITECSSVVLMTNKVEYRLSFVNSLSLDSYSVRQG